MTSKIQLDAFDVKILQELQIDGGLSNQELAEKIGLSASPCLRRVKILEENGIIEKRVTLLDRKKLGLDITAIIQIGMDRHTPKKFEVFEAQLKTYEEVIECYLITGQDADYTIKVVVPDMEAYQEFLLNHITTIPGVSSVTSSFVMRRVVDTGALPLKYVK
ncbi:Lrp/AsnC family transcriptional regulator [Cocleimonas flava]|jgi:Lrp/AsnC family leucine-responsive transcriptional regulator|uniref:AsnC family transcriptional regulator n=1 Tax=Cocleimonas flava TaxID=634765 RepID=A0A4R1F6M3_9GAMM|nr:MULTISPECIES: Lrp/AsnC family transcriptional regulator [Cocleimonas]MEB8434116.1 Lrp/AsnC family transcriptional regulator [Cocleimonas sp. KMM 6892]MEC4717024.1 Lrp/AsnC family transcriptional regulator [Cocleimonas sp. KMM 6895]MEC4746388.1 Lrp/AsnC family transcriptional regulator [Cocleimonas sp. KMM 6896]TCJ88222.1 AsnC family transcriptional regulator [Cocleimonas flava]